MTYYGDYGFEEFLQTGRSAEVRPVQNVPAAWACTGFVATDETGRRLVGRNFDWRNRGALLLYTDSSDGYASASMVDIAYLGYDAQTDTWREQPQGANSTCWRYNTAYETLEQANGILSSDDAAMSLLNDVSQGNTIWSVVYGLTSGDIQIALGRDYEEVREFKLDMRE